MADLLWRVGAFAESHPSIASDFGRNCALQAAAIGKLYTSAGVAGESAIRGVLYPPVDDPCCTSSCPTSGDSACARGCCAGCTDVDEEFEGAFPEVDDALDEAHALNAAVLDILADADVEDVRAALDQALELAAAGELSAHYVPKAPARPLPSGEPAPEKCPICGCMVCPTCGCPCQCCDGAADAEKGQAAMAANE